MKILVLAPFSDEGLARLRRLGDVVYEPWLATRRIWDPEELGARLHQDGIDAVIIEADFVLAETLAAAPGLRFIGLCRGDVGPHVDLEAAAQAGVCVVRASARNATAVAELTIGLMLALARRILPAHAAIVSGRWSSPLDGYAGFRGCELAGKTAGLIGLGAVGREVARRLLAFDMTLLAHDPPLAERGGESAGVPLVGLDELLRRSDFVCLHAAVTPSSAGIIGARELALMRPGAYLVNTARAALVDEQALLQALQERRLAGAALDVHSVEPLPPNSAWLALDNVILTPHIGGASDDVVRRHSEAIVADLERWLRGEPVPGRVV